MKEIVDHQRSVVENANRPPDPLIIGVGARPERVSLSGAWQAVIDPYDAGALAGMAPRADEPRSPSDMAEFSFENGLVLDVPGDWNSQDPRLVFYQGVVWYKRTFEHRPAPGRRTFLHFGAANHEASVYLNGRLIGRHEGGFTPFNFEVSEDLEPGENLLVVRVDNRREPEDVPTPITDWHNYGGLTREVSLLDLPETFIRSWGIQLDPDDPKRISGFVQLDGPSPSGITVSIPELDVSASVEPDSSGRAEFRIDADPERWSPATPKLYAVTITTDTDRVTDEIGFRTIETQGTRILLNGEPIFLRGISIHDEALGPAGRIHDRQQAVALLDLADELGANFIRLAHYTHDESMVQEADQRGLLVWGEIPVYWNIAFDDPQTLLRAKRQLSEMIERDRNRASIILWSIGNETPYGKARDRFMAYLAEHVRHEDPSRLVTAAMVTGLEALGPFLRQAYLPALLGFPPAEWIFPIHDPLGDVVDVLSVNEYFGWYYSGALARFSPFPSHMARRVMLENMDRIRFDLRQDKPVLISEMGAGALAGWHAPAEDLVVFSEEYQALVYERQFDMIEKQPMVTGMSPWILKDFRAPLRLYQGVQDHWNRKGLVDDDGRKKLAFDVLRSYYHERAERAENDPRQAIMPATVPPGTRTARASSTRSGDRFPM
ncbi:MAG TPA: beta-glucuronidase [Deltaproteobacteria bacterium]|nr:beta-glucuronidase [Deltaproteobacteria bacterium]